MLKTLSATAVALGLSVVGASAAVINYTPLDLTALESTTPVANISASGHTGTFFENVVGNKYSGTTLIARSPWENTSHESTDGVYSSVQGGGSATYTFNETQHVFSLIWGSPDNYNNIDLVLSGPGGALETINGSQVFGTAGILASAVKITGVSFDTLTIRSSSNAFEYANLTSSVPLPATGLLLLGGLGGIAALKRRKKAA